MRWESLRKTIPTHRKGLIFLDCFILDSSGLCYFAFNIYTKTHFLSCPRFLVFEFGFCIVINYFHSYNYMGTPQNKTHVQETWNIKHELDECDFRKKKSQDKEILYDPIINMPDVAYDGKKPCHLLLFLQDMPFFVRVYVFIKCQKVRDKSHAILVYQSVFTLLREGYNCLSTQVFAC